MRYIGNKTRLLPFIAGALDRLDLHRGRAHDAFSGTAAVGRALKARGWRVASSDLMTYSYVFQRAYVVAQRSPSLATLRAGEPELRRASRSPAFARRVAARGGRPLDAVAEYLEHWLSPESGFVTRHFAPPARMYFTADNAARIDAIRSTLQRWWSEGLLSDDGYYLMLAALLEAADRVANTAGVYAAYIKRWQPNALRDLSLEPLSPVSGARGSSAHRGDAAEIARRLGPVDLIYVDPPYNARQYAGYYHVPELIARGWFEGTPVLRGKTGLLGSQDQRSDWCSAHRVGRALESLLHATGATHILISYNSEGLLSEGDLRDILAEYAIDGRVRCFRHSYKRYRADSDRPGRQYRGDRVQELLLHARLAKKATHAQ